MKKYFFLMALGATLMTSCGKDDDDDKQSNSELIKGNWSLDHAHSIEYLNGVKVDEDMDTYSLDLMFTASTFMVMEGGDTSDIGTYTVSESSLNLYGEDTLAFKLRKLDEDELNISLEDKFVMGSDEYRSETTFYFEK